MESMILKSLIKIEKRIHSLYVAIEKEPEKKDEYIETLLNLISKENELILSIKLSPKKLKEIENEYINRVGLSIETSLPLGLSSHLNDTNYPYYRLIARLRYACAKQNDSINLILEPYFLDVEIKLLYRIILGEIENKPVDFLFRKSLAEYSHLILIDSPNAEMEILKRRFTPVEYVDDCIEFCTTLLCWSYMQKLKKSDSEIDKNILKEYTESKCLLDNKRSLNVYRIPRFNEKANEIIRELCNLGSTGSNYRTPDFDVKVAYLKTIIALLDRKSRTTAYKSILSYEKFRNSKYPWLMDFIRLSMKDIENNIVPSIRKVAMNPTYKMS